MVYDNVTVYEWYNYSVILKMYYTASTIYTHQFITLEQTIKLE